MEPAKSVRQTNVRPTKVVVVGAGNSGKTSFIKKFIHNTMSLNYSPTLGTDIFPFKINKSNGINEINELNKSELRDLNNFGVINFDGSDESDLDDSVESDLDDSDELDLDDSNERYYELWDVSGTKRYEGLIGLSLLNTIAALYFVTCDYNKYEGWEEDEAYWERNVEIYFKKRNIPVIYIASKCDVLSEKNKEDIKNRYNDVIFISSLNEFNFQIIRDKLASF
jgi:small GTP-binding protein